MSAESTLATLLWAAELQSSHIQFAISHFCKTNLENNNWPLLRTRGSCLMAQVPLSSINLVIQFHLLDFFVGGGASTLSAESTLEMLLWSAELQGSQIQFAISHLFKTNLENKNLPLLRTWGSSLMAQVTFSNINCVIQFHLLDFVLAGGPRH